ncbi:MAG: electron transport complex subunit RsxC [Victivallaceae bacterium]|nr:electron transport complex subunit RsxC [Victivallaceae bacterium]
MKKIRLNKSSRPVMTFEGGVHPVESGKLLSCYKPVSKAPLLERYTVLVHQNAGKPPKPVVSKGDHVLKYQLLAAADGGFSANVHSPTSGTVFDIVEGPGPLGIPAQTIVIDSDGLDEGAAPFEPIDWRTAEVAALVGRVREAGVVGMGGAGFPTAMKLTPPPGKSVDTLILNGAQCEPYLSADHRLMLESPERVLEGAAISGRILGVSRIFLGIEINKKDAIETLEPFCERYGVTLFPLEVRYPQGSEKQLISAMTGRMVPSGGLPADAGCVVQNVGTAAAVRDAVVLGLPVVERIVTVTGEVVAHPGNWLLRIGTPVIKALELAGGVTEEPGKLILGGPMMGFSQNSYEVPVSKNTSGILLLPGDVAVNYGSGDCVRCGRCVQGCPMNLESCLIATAIEGGRIDLAEQNHVMDCLECGSCAYVCLAHRPLVQLFRRAKAEIRRMRAAGNGSVGK